MNSIHAQESKRGNHFAFGKNWERFLKVVNEHRIEQAMQSLCNNLGVEELGGKTFLDIGSGSGLFSLAAHRLGAKVHSFDYDLQSVACTAELKKRYARPDVEWTIEQGSALDRSYLQSLGQWDIVYSWGVLHHTGNMWESLENVSSLVSPGGYLFISIYNDQGGPSRRWRLIKRIYNRLPKILRVPYAVAIMGPREANLFLMSCIKGRPFMYFDNIIHYSERSLRGMSYWYDIIDWLGGYPFEVAKPEDIFGFYRERGFVLQRLKTCAGSIGCNEFVFQLPAQ